MKILGIESSSLVASAAILDGDRLIAEYTVNNGLTHSQTLLPMIDAVVSASRIEPGELDAIAVSRGPGSFTGLRIGSATAKGLGLALNKPIVGVPTLAAMAYGLSETEGCLICPIMDARRGEVYSAVYRFENNVMKTVFEESAGPVQALIEQLNRLGERTVFLGDGCEPCRSIIDERLKTGHSFAPAHLSRQRAGSVAALGLYLFKNGEAVPSGEHVPVYLRVSQAEREKSLKS